MSASASLPGQPLPLRLLLDHAVGVSRRHFRAIYPAVAVPLAIASAAFPLAQALFMGPFMRAARQPGPSQVAAITLGALAGLAFFFVTYVFAYGALYMAAVDAVAGRPISMSATWRRVTAPRVWGTMMLSWAGFVAGLVCCVLPGLYIGILWCLVVAVMVEESTYGSAALGRSAQLIGYNPQGSLASDPRGKAFLIVFVGTLMGYALTLVVQLPFIVAQQVYVIRQAAGGSPVDPLSAMELMTWLQVPMNVLGAFVQTAVQLYIAIGIALLYFDVRGRKEGIDLEAALARIEGGAAPAPAE